MMKTLINKEEILQKLVDKRTKVLHYTRVVGYYRPIESFNKGKKGEFKERVYFREKNNL